MQWKQLYQQLDVQGPPGKALKKPGDKDLNAFEARHDFALPSSYREYIKVFGPGELGGYFRIYAPGYPDSGADLDRFVQMIQEIEDVFVETYGEEERVQRMMPFADTLGGDVIAWDPAVVTDPSKKEYTILILRDDSDKILKLAATFPDFIKDICLGSDFAKIIDDPTYEALQTFIPFGTETPGL